MKFIPILLAIALTIYTEKMMRILQPSSRVVSAIRQQYPIYWLLAFDCIVDVSWLIGIYACGLALAAYRQLRLMAEAEEELHEEI